MQRFIPGTGFKKNLKAKRDGQKDRYNEELSKPHSNSKSGPDPENQGTQMRDIGGRGRSTGQSSTSAARTGNDQGIYTR